MRARLPIWAHSSIRPKSSCHVGSTDLVRKYKSNGARFGGPRLFRSQMSSQLRLCAGRDSRRDFKGKHRGGLDARPGRPGGGVRPHRTPPLLYHALSRQRFRLCQRPVGRHSFLSLLRPVSLAPDGHSDRHLLRLPPLGPDGGPPGAGPGRRPMGRPAGPALQIRRPVCRHEEHFAEASPASGHARRRHVVSWEREGQRGERPCQGAAKGLAGCTFSPWMTRQACSGASRWC
jgi:hypothetical protein